MYLSKLELFGFKSFAQRVQVKFDSGLTAIVGPNGCGKTNIVDAIRWVLGEQKTSVLRSDKMENVIFNGTKTRRALGLSEISLTIENTKNILPTEYTEVTLTRRLYRSGESEYFLNKVPCRLRDILDLFVDTGMGSDAYSVIELKMVEQILSDNAEERRRLFEEAAGITKYKQRRKQTYKKLESAAQDLARVEDIISEVEKKVNSLERQAKKAAQVRTLKDELVQLEVGLAERQFCEFYQKLSPLRAELPAHEAKKTALSTVINQLETEIEAEQLKLVEIERLLSASQKEINAKKEQIVSTEKQLVSHKERVHSLDETIQRAKNESQTIELQRQTLASQKVTLERWLSERQTAYKETQNSYEAARFSHSELEERLHEQREEIEEKRQMLSSISKQISNAKLREQSLEGKIENITENLAQSAQRKSALDKHISQRRSVQLQNEAKLEALASEQLQADAALEAAKAQRAKFRESIDSAKERLLQLRSELNARHNRITFLKSLLESYEGLPEGIAHLEKSGSESYGLGCLSDMVATDDAFKLAVNAALGDALSYYICRTEQDALAAIRELRQSGKGKVSFVALEKLQPSPHAEVTCETALPKNVWRTLDIIRAPEEIRPLLELLLESAFVTETLASAQTLSETHPNAFFTTLSGERYRRTGFLHGGSVKESEGLRIGKKEELDTLNTKTQQIQTEIAQTEDALRAAQAGLADIAISEFENEVRRIAKVLTAEEKRQSQIQFEIDSFENEITQINSRLAKNAEEKAALEIDLDGQRPTLISLAADLERETQALELAVESGRSAESELSDSREVMQEENLKQKDAEFALEKARAELARNEQEHQLAGRQLERLETETAHSQEEVFRLNSEIESMNENLRHLYTEKDASEKVLAEVELTYSALKGDFNRHETSLRDAQRQREIESQMIFEFQKQTSRLEMQIENLETIIKNEYDQILEVKEFSEDDDFNQETATERIGQIKTRLKNLGAVNELALEEFKAEKERLDFLVSQRADLQSAEKQLLGTIEEINKTALEMFQDTFAKIRKNFANIFHSLFNEGDEADLVLEDSEDPLNANIDIVAKPKGKRPQSIMLLSGGEKTLTAISLLFAIYLVKPSPFCILDEVDAPLDDANIARFTKLLQAFSKDTQFIIVTHNKRTMEASRVLYGVTMEEEGVSKLVAVRMEGRDSDNYSKIGE